MPRRKVTLTAIQKLTPPDIAFIKEYVKTGAITRSYKKSHPDQEFTTTYTPAHAGQAVLKKKAVKQFISELMEREKVSAHTISAEISKEIFEKPSDSPQERMVKFNYIKLACQLLDLFAEKGKDAPVPIKIVYEQDEKINEPKTVEVDDGQGQAESNSTPASPAENTPVS
jgi:hypothetical protein